MAGLGVSAGFAADGLVGAVKMAEKSCKTGRLLENIIHAESWREKEKAIDDFEQNEVDIEEQRKRVMRGTVVTGATSIVIMLDRAVSHLKPSG